MQSATVIVVAWAQNRYYNLTVTMPHFDQGKETIVCSALKVPLGISYVRGIEPLGDHQNFHHFNLNGCELPGHLDPLGYSDTPNDNGDLTGSTFFTCMAPGDPTFPVCKGEGRIMYSYPFMEKDPVGYSFKVGDKIKYFVIGAHPPNGYTGEFGMKLLMEAYADNLIGFFVMGAKGFTLQPLSTVNIDCVGRVRSTAPVEVKFMTAHSHHAGDMTAVYKLTNQGQWQLVLKNVPHPIRPGNTISNVVLENGDVLVLRCLMTNVHNETIDSGTFSDSESCTAGFRFVYPNPNGNPDPRVDNILSCLEGQEREDALKGAPGIPENDQKWLENDFFPYDQEPLPEVTE